MKKLLLVGSAMAMLSTSAMASQARLLALGMNETDNEGMYHISDRRNMFLNPAHINIYNNYVTVEYGENGIDFQGSSLDQDVKAKAQGGFFTKQGNLVYGMYLGNESNTSALLRVAGTSAAVVGPGNGKTLHSSDNQFDLFIGGEQGLKWAGNLTYSRGKDDSRKAKDLGIATRWGVIGSNWDAHLNLSLASKAEATDDASALVAPGTSVEHEFKGKLGFQVGGSYVFSGNNRAFGYVKHYAWEQKDNFAGYPHTIPAPPLPNPVEIGGQNGTVKGDFTSVLLGWGTHHEVNSTDKIYLSLSAKKTDINAKFANKGEIKHLAVPVSVAYEAVATEWLTLRGSVTQNIWGQKDNKNLASLNPAARGLIGKMYGTDGKGSIAASTDVRAGATLTFGNLEVDGLVGMETDTTGATPATKKAGLLKLDELFYRAAVTYTF